MEGRRVLHRLPDVRAATAIIENRLEDPARSVEAVFPAEEAELVVEMRAEQSQGPGLPPAFCAGNIPCLTL